MQTYQRNAEESEANDPVEDWWQKGCKLVPTSLHVKEGNDECLRHCRSKGQESHHSCIWNGDWNEPVKFHSAKAYSFQ
jgi:hypothetical protein